MDAKIPQSLSNDIKLAVEVITTDNVVLNPRTNEIWVEYVGGNKEKFLAKNIPNGTNENCYIDTDGRLIVCIPSNTFIRGAELLYRCMVRTSDNKFPDGHQDTWSNIVSTNIILTLP